MKFGGEKNIKMLQFSGTEREGRRKKERKINKKIRESRWVFASNGKSVFEDGFQRQTSISIEPEGTLEIF